MSWIEFQNKIDKNANFYLNISFFSNNLKASEIINYSNSWLKKMIEIYDTLIVTKRSLFLNKI